MNESVPRVLFINPWEKRIGPNRYLIELLRQDSKLACNSIVVLPDNGEAAEEYRSLGCRVEVWQEARLIHFKLSNLVYFLKIHTIGVIRGWRRMRSLKPSVVVTNAEAVWLGGIVARLLRIPHFQVFHGLALEYNWGTHAHLARAYVWFLSLWNTCFVAVSQAVAEMLLRYDAMPQQIRVIPNSFDLDALRGAAQQRLPPSLKSILGRRHPILVSVGRISSIKGHDLLVEALAKIKDRYPEIICIFAGKLLSNEGAEDTQEFYNRVLEQIDQLGLKSNVKFIGEVDYVPSLLKLADVYIQPSRSESFCRLLIEAQICGTPIVAFAVGAIPEVLGAGGGVLVPPGDTTELSNAIINLLSDPALRQTVVETGKRNAKRFDSKTVSPYLRCLVDDVLGSNKA